MPELNFGQLLLFAVIVIVGLINAVMDARKRRGDGTPPDLKDDSTVADAEEAAEREWREQTLEAERLRAAERAREAERTRQAERIREAESVQEDRTRRPERMRTPETERVAEPLWDLPPEPAPAPTRRREPANRPASPGRMEPAETLAIRRTVATRESKEGSGREAGVAVPPQPVAPMITHGARGARINASRAREAIVMMAILGPCPGLEPAMGQGGGPPGQAPRR